MKEQHYPQRISRNRLARALKTLGPPLGYSPSTGQRQFDPDDFPGPELGPRSECDYVQQLTFQKEADGDRPSFGYQLADFRQTLQTLGARAAKTRQTVRPPELNPHIAVLSQDETYDFLRQYGATGERLLREEADKSSDSYPAVPYTVHAHNDSVTVRIGHEDWSGHGQIAAMRAKLGLQAPQATGEPWTSVEIVSAPELNPRFAERVEQMNRYSLTLSIGRLGLF